MIKPKKSLQVSVCQLIWVIRPFSLSLVFTFTHPSASFCNMEHAPSFIHMIIRNLCTVWSCTDRLCTITVHFMADDVIPQPYCAIVLCMPLPKCTPSHRTLISSLSPSGLALITCLQICSHKNAKCHNHS